jgi:hypothetical protein
MEGEGRRGEAQADAEPTSEAAAKELAVHSQREKLSLKQAQCARIRDSTEEEDQHPAEEGLLQ